MNVRYHPFFKLALLQDDREHSPAKPTILQLALILLVAERFATMHSMTIEAEDHPSLLAAYIDIS
jgi:hypothetical protein